MSTEQSDVIAVDLDGTLVKWYGIEIVDYVPDKLGEPIPKMIARVKRWLAQGKEVVIFTARVHPSHDNDAELARKAIQAFCVEHFGVVLDVTCMKDPRMKEIWDDRVVTVEKDTGRILTEGIVDEEDDPDSLGAFIVGEKV